MGNMARRRHLTRNMEPNTRQNRPTRTKTRHNIWEARFSIREL